jgi:hypothetical protein
LSAVGRLQGGNPEDADSKQRDEAMKRVHECSLGNRMPDSCPAAKERPERPRPGPPFDPGRDSEL